MNVKQFEVVLVNLNPTKGSEQSGTRPCLVLQTNAVSEYGNTTIVAVITSKKVDKIYPYEFFIAAEGDNGLTQDSKVKLDQIKVIDKSRIIKVMGKIEDKNIIKEIFSAMDNIFDKQGYFR